MSKTTVFTALGRTADTMSLLLHIVCLLIVQNVFTMKLPRLLLFIRIERSLLSLWCKTKTNTPLMHEVLDKDTIKSKILHHLSVAKRGYVSKMTWRKSFYTFSTSQKTGCRWQMTSAFPWYCFRWPWAVCPTTTRVGGRKRTCFLCRCPCART